MDKPCRLVFCTCPDASTAEHLAATLVEERLAACAKLIPGLTSIYRWEGALQRDSEVLLLLKTRAEHFERLAERLRALHPYNLPEIVAVAISEGSPAYLGWLLASTEIDS